MLDAALKRRLYGCTPVPAKIPESEQRRFQRAKVHFSLDCSIRIDQPTGVESVVEDISAGGLRIHLINTTNAPPLRVGDSLTGAIESLNPALQMSFRGKVLWVREIQDPAGAAFHAGISFDPDVVLAELILALQPTGAEGRN